ncbi:MAG: oligosaccharide flippase family protein [Lachnospiraceae bacterium]|nr:oligosaccharide flippase family protein [Lachnospiraceae bacterium]
MEKGNRSKNAKRNMASGIANKLLMIILPFIIRTVIIRRLGADYAGLGGLFTSILQVLNMAELGFSSAIVFSLYKPVAEGNQEEICSLLAYYKKVYVIVGTVITVAGLLVLPFLPFLTKGECPEDLNIYVIYLVYLASTSISYFAYAYKSVILTATQRQDIISNIDSVICAVKNVIQIIVLWRWGNYYYYIFWNLVFTVVNNIVIAWVTKKKYPEYYPKGRISEQKSKEITTQIKGIAIGKISLVARNAFDNIVLSIFCGLIDVTIYSNYYYIFSSILGLYTVLIQALSAGIGNSIAVEEKEKNYYDFKRLYCTFSALGGFCTICFFCLYQPFMKLWVGEELTASNTIMILFCVYFYLTQMGQVRSMYANAAGLWWEFRKLAIGEMILNLTMNFVLGYFYGMTGILFTTIGTVFVFSIIGNTVITFQKYFEKKSTEFWTDSLVYLVITVIAALLTYKIFGHFVINNWFGFMGGGAVCALCASVFMVLPMIILRKYRTYLISVIRNLVRK